MKKVVLFLIACVLYTGTVTAQDPVFSIARYYGDKACATSFTFDDGLSEHISVAAPELEKRGWKGTFWICGAKVNGERRIDPDFMTWDEIRTLSDRGHEISSHGWSHKKLTRLEKDMIAEEVEKNDSAILMHTGRKPVTFCYPYNSRNGTVMEIAGKGRVGTRTSQFALGQAVDGQKTKKRIDDAVRNGSWAIWMTHGIHTGYDSFEDPGRFTEFLDYVQSKEDSIWVGTFMDVASYMAERDATRLHVSGKGSKWTVTPSIDLDPELYRQHLTLVINGTGKDVKARQAGKRLKVFHKNGKALVDFDPFGGRISVKL